MGQTGRLGLVFYFYFIFPLFKEKMLMLSGRVELDHVGFFLLFHNPTRLLNPITKIHQKKQKMTQISR
ncbi:hypothetical protein, partial [Sphingobacterium bovisgrunnientis]|uniref:hypothetical protein n=1 Tax=Sphingobacterium bovisgrunnientis TaxID=1874697 RepID=UPI00195B787D